MGNDLSSLHNAAAKDHAGAVRILIDEEHVDPNLKDKDGWRPLHFAAYGGSEKATAELLKRGADVRGTDEAGRTPLHLAALQGKLGVIKQLLDARAPVSAADEHGMTPLHKAAVGGRPEAVQLLLDAGASLEATLTDGSTPLHLATWKGKEDTVKTLIQHGASYKSTRHDGQAPLHEAAEIGNTRLVQAFLALGADANIRDKEGHTAAELALDAGHRDIADLIGQHAPNRSHGYGKDVDAAFDSAPTPASSPLVTAQHLHAHGQRPGGSASPASPAYRNNAPSAPPAGAGIASKAPQPAGVGIAPKTPQPAGAGIPSKTPQPAGAGIGSKTPDTGGKVAYPSVYDPANKSSSSSSSTKQDVPDPDWWSKNIGRDAKAFNDAKNVPLPDEKQESLRPREQFERAVQQKVGSIFGGFKLPGQGQQQRPKEPQPQDEDWSGAQSDDWGGASSKPVPRNEKYDTKPYDDDDYRSDISPRRGQESSSQDGRSLETRLAELELSADRTQGWVRGGTKQDAKEVGRQKQLLTQQEREIAHLKAQLERRQAAEADIDRKGHTRSNDHGIPSEYICPITQEVFEDPVLAADGYTYEREPILKWLQTGHTASPMTGDQLAHPGLTPNHALRSAVRQWQGR